MMRIQAHQNEPIAREFAMLTCGCLKMSQKDPLHDFFALIFQLRLETWYQLGSPDSYWAVLDPLKNNTGRFEKAHVALGVAPFFIGFCIVSGSIGESRPEPSSPLDCQHAPIPSKSRASVGVAAMPGRSQNCTSRSPKHQCDKRKLPACTKCIWNVSIWFNAAPRDAHENQSVALFRLLHLNIGAKSASITQNISNSWDV